MVVPQKTLLPEMNFHSKTGREAVKLQLGLQRLHLIWMCSRNRPWVVGWRPGRIPAAWRPRRPAGEETPAKHSILYERGRKNWKRMGAGEIIVRVY